MLELLHRTCSRQPQTTPGSLRAKILSATEPSGLTIVPVPECAGSSELLVVIRCFAGVCERSGRTDDGAGSNAAGVAAAMPRSAVNSIKVVRPGTSKITLRRMHQCAGDGNSLSLNQHTVHCPGGTANCFRRRCWALIFQGGLSTCTYCALGLPSR